MKKILIIEDDPVIGHIYKTRLEKEGYKVEIAADGQSGFFRIHEFEPDAVLLDLMLPKMNGVEILKKIRAQSKYAKTPVIVFTNAYVPNMINESFLAGATMVFNKATLTPRQMIDSLYGIIYSGIPADGTPPKTTAESDQTKSETNSPEVENFLHAAVGEEAFHSSPPSFAVAEHSSPSSFAVAEEPPATQGSSQNASAVMVAPEAVQAEDSEFQAELLKTFLRGTQEALVGLRKATQEFSKAQDEADRLEDLLELYRKVHALTGSAGIAGVRNISKMAAAVEVLLKELYEKPKNLNASTMRTVASAVDLLGILFKASLDPKKQDIPAANILVIDDEAISRRAITYALEKAKLKCVSAEEPHAALDLMSKEHFDLVFLDVDMPGMNGFELCTKLRALPTYKKTPVVFVTSLNDFESRANSTMSGGNDFIGKPFLFMELAVKALLYVFRGRLDSAKLVYR
jgi:DNA-binding response OmpR family regulator/HPt (histidine-containing phosphotransfer) domain-containing protein